MASIEAEVDLTEAVAAFEAVVEAMEIEAGLAIEVALVAVEVASGSSRMVALAQVLRRITHLLDREHREVGMVGMKAAADHEMTAADMVVVIAVQLVAILHLWDLVIAWPTGTEVTEMEVIATVGHTATEIGKVGMTTETEDTHESASTKAISTTRGASGGTRCQFTGPIVSHHQGLMVRSA